MNKQRIGLDDASAYNSLDATGMLDRLHEFPVECGRAFKMATEFPLPDELGEVDRVVVLGMGGSAIGGDMLASFAESESAVPIQVCRGYRLPAWVGRRTLVAASSYSGNTEETLACFRESVARGARNLIITTGGALKELAGETGIPAFVYDYKSQPRAAFPYGFLVLLCFMKRLGFIDAVAAGIEDVPSMLSSFSRTIDENVPEIDNSAKQLARFMFGKLTVVYGAELVAEVAHRWKTQINENSKNWAFYETLPEMNHNSVVGYECPPDLRAHVSVILIASSFLSERVRIRYGIVRQLLDRCGISSMTVDGAGARPITQVMNLVLLGDYASYYLAILNGMDPTPVHAIDYLKTRLAETSRS